MAKAQNDDCRQNTESDNVTQRVNLDAKGAFFLCTVFLGAGNLTVKHIAQTAQQQRYGRQNRVTGHGKCHTADG